MKWRLTFFTFVLTLASTHALAQQANAPLNNSAPNNETQTSLALPQQQVERFIQDHLGLNGARVEIVIGKLDPRLKLRPCEAIEPFLPSGTRLWGRANVGLRCKEERGWTVFLPVEVKVFAQVAVAARTLNAGQTLAAEDLAQQERDITRLNGTPVTEAAQLQGRVLARGFAAGQPLVQQALRAQPIINSGDPVKVLVQGAGFAVTTAGVALVQAELGQAIRIRLDNGRTLQGVAQTGRIVEIKL